MTEEEAKTKWCFHFIASHTDPRMPPSQYERDELGNASPFLHNCIGSACMAWRCIPNGDNRSKIEAIRDHRGLYGSTLATAKAAVEATWREPKERGYCGLAGAPQ